MVPGVLKRRDRAHPNEEFIFHDQYGGLRFGDFHMVIRRLEADGLCFALIFKYLRGVIASRSGASALSPQQTRQRPTDSIAIACGQGPPGKLICFDRSAAGVPPTVGGVLLIAVTKQPIGCCEALPSKRKREQLPEGSRDHREKKPRKPHYSSPIGHLFQNSFTSTCGGKFCSNISLAFLTAEDFALRR